MIGPGLRSYAWRYGLCLVLLSACDDEDGAAEPIVPADAGPPPATQTLLDGTHIPQFAQALPILDVAGGTIPTLTGNAPLTIRMCELWANVLPPGTLSAGLTTKTRVWAYIKGDACPANGPDAEAIDSYFGPVIISERSDPPTNPRPPTTVTWVNDLGTTEETQVLAYKRSVDQTIHWANPLGQAAEGCVSMSAIPEFGSLCSRNYVGPIPAVVHLHGGEVPPGLDGGPEAWFLSQPAPGYLSHGPAYYSKGGDEGNRATYAYPNVQEAAPLWFHDHTLGATTLNVYAGLAGAYLVIDPDLRLPPGLTAIGLEGPSGSDRPIIPLVIQDRFFDTNGQLFYPVDQDGGMPWSPNPQHPYWTPEIFGDTNLVNGKVWPFLEVEPKRYRFLLVDGAASRGYALGFVDQDTGAAGPPIWVIGTEDGYIDKPLATADTPGASLVMMPGERYDVIVDFSGLAPGTRLILTNSAAAPYPDGDAPNAATDGRVLQIRVGACRSGSCGASDPSYDPAGGAPLRTGADRLVRFSDPATGRLVDPSVIQKTRQLTLNEVLLPPSTATSPVTGQPNTSYPGGPLMLFLNNTRWSGESTRTNGDFTTISLGGQSLGYSELPQEGDAEVWELVNLTGDAHPIHTHLSDMQIVNRQAFDVDGYTAAYNASFPDGQYLAGFGPPLDYATGNPRALGGNPDVTPFLVGAASPPAAYEAAWKDTILAPPGQVTRVVVRYASSSLPLNAPAATRAYPFDPSGPGGYVWHCHITTHEDNEMMRPVHVRLNPAAPPPSQRPLQLGRDY